MNCILFFDKENIEVYSNFKKLCLVKGLSYHGLKNKPFPIDVKGGVKVDKLKIL